MPTPFITNNDLTNLIGKNVDSDPGATIAVDAACDMVRTFTDQDINKGTSNLTLDGSGTDALVLPQMPVQSAGSVKVDGTIVTDYVLNDSGILIRKSPTGSGTTLNEVVWPYGRQNIELTYVHGYDSADVPRDIKMVALSVAQRIIVQGVSIAESIGNDSVRYSIASTDFTDGENRILDKYKF